MTMVICQISVQNKEQNQCRKKVYREALTKLLVKDLDEWCKAVSCARGIADDGFIRVVGIGIDTHHIGWDITFTRCSDQNLLGTCLNVLTSTFSVHEHSSSLYHQVNSQIPEQNTKKKKVYYGLYCIALKIEIYCLLFNMSKICIHILGGIVQQLPKYGNKNHHTFRHR